MTQASRRGFIAGSLAVVALAVLPAACQTDPDPSANAAIASGSGSIEDIRAAAGLRPLTRDPRLERAAIRQAGYMARAGRMTHSTGPGRGFAARVRQEGIAGAAAENLAHGRMDTGRVFGMWMRSPGHRRNMLNPRFSRYGLAHADAPGGGRFWALVLAD